jgi:uncharacterized membrane protein
MIAALQPSRAGLAEYPARQHPFRNVGETERWASLVGGGALAALGLMRGGLAGVGLGLVGAALAYRGLSGHCHLYGLLRVNTAGGPHGPTASLAAGAGVKVEKAVTVNRDADELYRFWRNFSNLPRVMTHLESVTPTMPGRTRWVARAPLGIHLQWEAEVINDRENELIAWRSLPGGGVDTAGSIHLNQVSGTGSTEVHVVLKYDQPTGQIGATLARWLGQAPEQQIEADLHNFKRLMEAGELPTAQGQVAARF